MVYDRFVGACTAATQKRQLVDTETDDQGPASVSLLPRDLMVPIQDSRSIFEIPIPPIELITNNISHIQASCIQDDYLFSLLLGISHTMVALFLEQPFDKQRYAVFLGLMSLE